MDCVIRRILGFRHPPAAAMKIRTPAALLIVAALLLANHARAHQVSREECSEGSDFIRNAAVSRDNGMDGMTFMNRAMEDFQTIRAFPPSLRWFVQDERDEDFLLKAISGVFSVPREPAAHQREFLAACFEYAAAAKD